MVPIKIHTQLGLQTVIFVGLGCFLWDLSDRRLREFVSFNLLEFGLGLAIGLGLIAVIGAFMRGFSAWGEKLVRLQSHNFKLLGFPLSPATIAFISICAGVGEEALFRGGLQTIASDHIPVALAVVLASIPFALIHFSKPIVAFIQFLIGCLLGVVYLYTGSLLAVMIAHTVYDVYALWHLQREVQRLGLLAEE